MFIDRVLFVVLLYLFLIQINIILITTKQKSWLIIFAIDYEMPEVLQMEAQPKNWGNSTDRYERF